MHRFLSRDAESTISSEASKQSLARAKETKEITDDGDIPFTEDIKEASSTVTLEAAKNSGKDENGVARMQRGHYEITDKGDRSWVGQGYLPEKYLQN